MTVVFLASMGLTTCPDPDTGLIPENEEPTDPAVTIEAGEDTASGMVTYRLNAGGAVFDEPTTEIWRGRLYCSETTIVGEPTEAVPEMPVEVVPLDLEGAELTDEASSADWCGGGRVAGHPVPCQPAQPCERSWKVTFHRPPGIQLPVLIRWDLPVLVEYKVVGLEEVPPDAEVTREFSDVERPGG